VRVATRMLALAPEPVAYLRLIHDSCNDQDKAAWAKRSLDAAIARRSDWETANSAIVGARLAAHVFQGCNSLSSSSPRQQQSRADAAAEVTHLLGLARTSLRRMQSLMPTALIHIVKMDLKQVSLQH